MSRYRNIFVGAIMFVLISEFMSGCSSNLVDAVKDNNVQAISKELEAGKDPNSKVRYIRGYEYPFVYSPLIILGWPRLLDHHNPDPTLLALAAEEDKPDVARLLLEKGADPNLTKQNQTAPYPGMAPLHIAVVRKKLEIVRLLLEYGADVDLRSSDYERRTALMMAAEQGDAQLVDLLLVAGASPSEKDRSNATARALAESRGFTSVARRLQLAETAGTKQTEQLSINQEKVNASGSKIERKAVGSERAYPNLPIENDAAN